MPSTRGDLWICRKILGSGSFGEVLLYELGETKQYIALKKCKTVLQNENLKRWRDEVAFMRDLKHAHIVQGHPVPPGLEAKPTEPPRLAMEYCSRGDLRKKLSELPNMCGLPEAEILLLAKHIASAMEYLHGQKIIHRDIKPENIMLQEYLGQTMYKLTDLGFAKDSKNQPAVSFVGTKEYMAPELYSQTEYTKTADYWSFGTVLSEVITGNRPFMLSVLPVVRWHEIIAKKDDKDIGYYEDSNGNVSYARNLPEPHQLCRPFRESLEKLLALLLRADSSRRGGDLRDGKPVFYHGFEAIFSCKVIHVRNMIDGTMASFPTRNNDSVSDLTKTLANVTKLPSDQHILLLANGERLLQETAILHDIFRDQQGDRIVYLYPKDIPINNTNFYIPPKTPMVTALMDSTHLHVSENGFKVMWKQSIHYCHQLIREATARQIGYVAFSNYNLRRKATMIQCCEEMKRCFHRLQAKAEFYLDSMRTDIQLYAHQAATGVCSTVFYDSMKEMEEKIKGVTQEPEEEVAEIGRKVDETVRFIFEMQKNSEKQKIVDGLRETSRKCDASFKKFKEENKVKRREDIDMMPIQSQIEQACRQYNEYNREIFTKIGEVQKSCSMLDEVLANIRNCVLKMEEIQAKILQLQKGKQKNMWDILTATIMKKKEAEAQLQRSLSRSRSLVGPTTPPSIGSNGRGPQEPIFVAAEDVERQSNNQMQDSMSILNESMQIQSEFDTVMRSVTEEQMQHAEELHSLDWTHLMDT